MKALGGSISRIVGLFLAEVGVLGAVGGLIGCIAGVALSQWMGQRVFGDVDHAALGSFSADDRADGAGGDGGRAAVATARQSEAGGDFARRIVDAKWRRRTNREPAKRVRERARARRRFVQRRRGRMDRHHGPVGLGQDDADQYSRRPRHAHFRQGHRGRHRRRAARRKRADALPRRENRLRLPAVSPGAVSHRARKRDAGAVFSQHHGRNRGARGARARGACRSHRASARAAFGRRTAARGRGARADQSSRS